jgi:tRNA-splicing ligase RtcB
MKKVTDSRTYQGQRIPIKMWLDNVEDSAGEQAIHLASLPFAFKHVALMPDCHTGMGMPIGGVLAAENVVIPNAVGTDIGCGMRAIKTDLRVVDLKGDTKMLQDIVRIIKEDVPVGPNHHKTMVASQLLPECIASNVITREFQAAQYQIGTLGSGNHFIEIQEGSDGFIWAMVHSGSRNVGYKVANYHNNVAITLNSEFYSSVPHEWGLAFLPLNSEDGQQYLNEMGWCVRFAKANRMMIMKQVYVALLHVFGEVDVTDTFDIAHNYAVMENHFGKNVMVHRKGATRARAGEIGIIPGSQGTASYIVKGLGNPESFMSCSHGAGRRMSRTTARERLSLDEEVAWMNQKGIVHSMTSKKDLDEARGAYKDIEEVMANQDDLVEIVTELKPLAVIKGN